MQSRSSKKGQIDWEFLVNILRAVLVIIIAVIVFLIFMKGFSNKEADKAKANLESLIETIKYMPSDAPPIFHEMDLGTPESYYIVDTLGSKNMAPDLGIPESCIGSDCLCLCSRPRNMCEDPYCIQVQSMIDQQQMEFHEYRQDNSDYVEITQTMKSEKEKKHVRIILKRSGNSILICPADECYDEKYCSCFAKYDAKVSSQMVESIKQAMNKCSPGLNGFSKDYDALLAGKLTSMPAQGQVYYYDMQNSRVFVYSMQGGELRTEYVFELNAPLQWQWQYGSISGIRELFLSKINLPAENVISCDDIKDISKKADYISAIAASDGVAVESGYCINEQVDEDKMNSLFWTLNENNDNPNTDIAGNAEEVVEQPITGQGTDAEADLRVTLNIKPYVRIISNAIIFSSVLQDHGEIYEGYDVSNIKAYYSKTSEGDMIYFTPHLFVEDTSNSDINRFSVSQANLLDTFTVTEQIESHEFGQKQALVLDAAQAKLKSNSIDKSCSANVANTLVADMNQGTQSSTEGYHLIIKGTSVYLKYNEHEEPAESLPTALDCVIYSNNDLNADADFIDITPADKDLEIVNIGIGELCLWKRTSPIVG